MKQFVVTLVTVFIAAGAYALSEKEQKDLIMLQCLHLADLHDYTAEATYEVLLPSAEEPITYKLKIASTPSLNDTLSLADYIIEWSVDRDGKESSGFTAYFDGNLYRYKDYRLQEYHAAEDIDAFAPGGDLNKGIQHQAQFYDALPAGMVLKLSEMLTDSSYTVSFRSDQANRLNVIDGVRRFEETEVQHVQYQFDNDMLPVKAEFTTNPGEIGEQTVIITYDYSADKLPAVAHSENELKDRYGEIFARYRERDFSIDNLPGRYLPAFSATTTTRERYRHTKNSGFAVPTVIAVIDSNNDRTGELIGELRMAIGSLDKRVDLIMAFADDDADRIEAVSGNIRPGEYVLVNARGLVRDIGASELPVVMVCNRDGIVKDLLIGDNNATADFVIRETTERVE